MWQCTNVAWFVHGRHACNTLSAGLEGVLEEGDAEYARFRRNFAVRIAAVLRLPAGDTSLRISCPGKGGLFLESELVYSSPAAPNVTVCFIHRSSFI